MFLRIVIIFAGVILAGVFLNIYFFVFCGIVVFGLGFDNDVLVGTGYWLSLAGG